MKFASKRAGPSYVLQICRAEREEGALRTQKKPPAPPQPARADARGGPGRSGGQCVFTRGCASRARAEAIASQQCRSSDAADGRSWRARTTLRAAARLALRPPRANFADGGASSHAGRSTAAQVGRDLLRAVELLVRAGVRGDGRLLGLRDALPHGVARRPKFADRPENERLLAGKSRGPFLRLFSRMLISGPSPSSTVRSPLRGSGRLRQTQREMLSLLEAQPESLAR